MKESTINTSQSLIYKKRAVASIMSIFTCYLYRKILVWIMGPIIHGTCIKGTRGTCNVTPLSPLKQSIPDLAPLCVGVGVWRTTCDHAPKLIVKLQGGYIDEGIVYSARSSPKIVIKDRTRARQGWRHMLISELMGMRWDSSSALKGKKFVEFWLSRDPLLTL